MTDDTPPFREGDWPGVHRAVEVSAESCRQSLQLLNAMNGQLQHLQTVSASLLFAIPTLLRAAFPSMDLTAWPLLAVIILGGLSFLVATWARLYGLTRIISPVTLSESWLESSPARFDYDLMATYVSVYTKNRRLASIKHGSAVLAVAFLAVQAMTAGAWVAFDA